MRPTPRVVFLGNHTVGVRAMKVLARKARLAGVVAHPEDPEDGVRYESVHAAALKVGVPCIRATGSSEELARFVDDAQPDLIWITDYRYLLPCSVLELAKSGTINLHPSLLPKYRGRAPINWAILNGESELGLTAHWVDAGMDTGDIIMQRKFILEQCQDVGDALQLLYPIYENLTEYVIDGFKNETLSQIKQNEAEASVFPRRKPEDGLIDWHRPARDVWNLVRAVAQPYPGAFAPWQGGVLKVHRISGITQFPQGEPPKPGTPAEGNDGINSMHIACLDAFVNISNYTFETHTEQANQE